MWNWGQNMDSLCTGMAPHAREWVRASSGRHRAAPLRAPGPALATPAPTPWSISIVTPAPRGPAVRVLRLQAGRVQVLPGGQVQGHSLQGDGRCGGDVAVPGQVPLFLLPPGPADPGLWLLRQRLGVRRCPAPRRRSALGQSRGAGVIAPLHVVGQLHRPERARQVTLPSAHHLPRVSRCNWPTSGPPWATRLVPVPATSTDPLGRSLHAGRTRVDRRNRSNFAPYSTYRRVSSHCCASPSADSRTEGQLVPQGAQPCWS